MTNKEKKSKIADILMDFQEEYSNEVINRPMLASLYAGNILSFIDTPQEEPVSIDFEQELYKAFGQVKDFTLGMRIAKRFYEIGRNHQEPVSEDLPHIRHRDTLDEFAYQCAYDLSNDWAKETPEWRDVKTACKLGAKWQKQKDSIVSEELEEASKEWLKPQLDKSYADYGEVKMMELTHFDGYAMLDAIEFGAEWQKEHLWKPADGDDLPEYEREVVVFTQNFPDDAGLMRVAIGHRPNPDGWDGKSIATGKVEHYTPQTYDKGGWNIPDVKYWLDCYLPKEIEL